MQASRIKWRVEQINCLYFNKSVKKYGWTDMIYNMLRYIGNIFIYYIILK